MHIRPAVLEDAVAACAAMRRSITELCEADHHHDPAILNRWLANKTPEVFARWLADSASTVLVAEHEGQVAAVGAIKHDGEIVLNYVSPDFRLLGASKMMLAGLEAIGLEKGNTRTRLDSTQTARGFYRSVGYVDNGAPQPKFGGVSYPMSKQIA